MIFSVAPTLGKDREIYVPWIPSGAQQRRHPPDSSISTPSRRNASMCRSMGRGPSSQPPGKHSSASPHREMIAPKNTMEDRISRISSGGIWKQVMEVSTTRLSPCQWHRLPRCSKIRTAVSTSERWGQLCSTVCPRHSTVAASSGRVLFFAPCTFSSPQSSAGPSMTIIENTSPISAYAIV